MSRISSLIALAVASAVAMYGATTLIADNNPTHAKTHANKALRTQRNFVIHSQRSAPQESKMVLDSYVENFKFVPNLCGVMADSPALLRSYWQLQQNLRSMGSLTPAENNVVQMAIAVENRCQYCVAGHCMAAGAYFGSSAEEIEALRSRKQLPQKKLDALRRFAIDVYESKGRVSDESLQAFFAAGYSRQQALDVVTNIAAKVMSNYTNQIARTPLDEAIKPFAKGLPFQEDRAILSE